MAGSDWADAFREWESTEANAELQSNIEMSLFLYLARDDKWTDDRWLRAGFHNSESYEDNNGLKSGRQTCAVKLWCTEAIALVIGDDENLTSIRVWHWPICFDLSVGASKSTGSN